MKPKQSLYRHCFTHFTDALIPVHNLGFRVLAEQQQEAFRQHVLELAALEGDERLLAAEKPQRVLAPGAEITAILVLGCVEKLGSLPTLAFDQPEAQTLKVAGEEFVEG